MFNMESQLSTQDDGYQLRITFNREEKKYIVGGYILIKGKGWAQDGGLLKFDTMEEAIASIVDYPS